MNSFKKSTKSNTVKLFSKKYMILCVVAALFVLNLIYDFASEHTNNELAKVKAQGEMKRIEQTTNFVSIDDNFTPLAGSVDYGFTIDDIPTYDGVELAEIHNGKTYFTASEKEYVSEFSTYQKDEYNRPGQVFALISSVSDEYNNISSCYPLGYPILDSMMMAEDAVYTTVKDTGYSVLYRTTPIYEDNTRNLYGILVEAYSVDDCGKTLDVCVFCYNTAAYED